MGGAFMAAVLVPRRSLRESAIRYSHAIAAAILTLFVFVGFQNFYLAGNSAITGAPIVDELFVYAVSHATCATAWMLVLIVQPSLVASRNRKLHMTLGWWLLGLAALVAITGALVAVRAAALAPDLPVHGLTYRQFVVVMLTEMVVFSALVVIAIVNRTRPQVHRSLMLLTGLAILSAATDRIPPIQLWTGHEGWWGMFAPELLLGLIFIAVRGTLTGKVDRWFAGGLVVMMTLFLVAFELAKTAAWDRTLTSVFGI